MAKVNNSFSVTALFDGDLLTLTEETKDEIKIYDLRKVLNRFSGQKVRFSITAEHDDSEFLVDEE